MSEKHEVKYWERNPTLLGLYNLSDNDSAKTEGEAFSDVYLEELRSYLVNEKIVGNLGESKRWDSIMDILASYGSCCEYVGFEIGFKTAMKLFKECGIGGENSGSTEMCAGTRKAPV